MKTRRSLSIVALLFASACSGATSTELFEPVSSESNPAAPIVGQGGDDGSSGATSSSSSSSGGSSTSSSGSSSSSSGGSGNTNPGPAQDGGGPTAPTCTAEVEPNDEATNTNWFTGCITGTVKRDDRDFASISAPITATKVKVTHEETGGDVKYRVSINDIPFDTFVDDDPKGIPVFGGATYTFEISRSGGRESATRTYELRVTFE